MDRRQIRLSIYSSLYQVFYNLVADYALIFYPHDIDKPRMSGIRAGMRRLDRFQRCKLLRIPSSQFFALFHQKIELLHLRKTERRAHLVHAVVVAQALVVEPLHVGRAALIAEATEKLVHALAVGYHHASLARRHLFIGVEGKNASHAERAGLHSAVLRAQRFASVFNN